MADRRGSRRRTAVAAALALAGLAAGCAAAAPRVLDPGLAAVPGAEPLVPAGYGSLLQDDVTLSVRAEAVLLKVTPLEEWVLRLTAPDTWSRLSSLAAAHRDEIVRRTGVERPTLFLVSFFGTAPGAEFRPDDVRLQSRGRTLRPLVVRPVTAGWGEGRVQQGATHMAVFGFADVDLEQPLGVEYGGVTSGAWEEVLRRLDVERGRARARAGLAG